MQLRPAVLLASAGLAILAAAPTWPQSAAVARGVSLSAAAEVNLTDWTGRTESIAADATRLLADRDVLATGLAGSGTVASPAGWTAALGASTRVSLRTEALAVGSRVEFHRMLDLTEGSLTWHVKSNGPSFLRTPVGLLSADAAKVNVSYANGKLNIETADGAVELDGKTAHVVLKSGQRLIVSYMERTGSFHVEMLEDDGNPVDVVIGKTTLHLTKGDIVDAAPVGEHLDVRVAAGVVQLTGPDNRTLEGSPGAVETVVGGGVGAVGRDGASKRARQDLRWRHWLEPRRRGAFRDRSDISPS